MMMNTFCCRLLLLTLVASPCWAVNEQCSAPKALSLFPGFHLLKLEERDPDTRAFLANHFKKDNPSVVHADFDGDGQQDYGLLLKKDNSDAAKFAVVLCPSADQPKVVYNLDLTGPSQVVYLKRIPAGTRSAQTEAGEDDVPAVTLKTVGIRLVYFEKAEVVLYWNPKLHKIEEIETGD